MINLSLQKYKEYCRSQDMKGGSIFKISQKEGKTFKDYVSRFLFNVQ